MVSSLRFMYRLVIICYLLQLALYKSGARAENSYLRKKCPNYICNPPSKSDNCDEIEDPSKLSGDEFSFLPEDQCCPVYQCTSADGNGFIGIFSGSNQIVVDTKSEGDEENMCQGVTCKSMPSLGKCSARNATTLASTLVYGPARICCPVFACTHANGTTTMHYGIFIDKDSSQTEIKPAPRPKGRSFLGLIPPSVKVKAKAKPPAAEADSDVFIPDTSDSADEPTVPKAGCAGIFCMTGQPSKDCRKSTPADIKGLMKIQEDCCPTWTCTHSHNGSLYYVHVGMQQKSKFWFVANLANDDDLSSPPVTEPLESDGGSNSSLATVQVLGGNEVSILPTSGAKATEANDLDFDAEIGVKTMSLPRTPSPDCPRVECIMAPEKQLRICSVLMKQDAEKFKLLGIQASCCPMFKCIGSKKAFLVQFGMFAAEPSSNSTTTENPNASSMRPQTTMTPTKATTTTEKPMTTTTTTEKPTTTTTITEKPTTTTTTTEKPTTTTTTTTENPITTTTTTEKPRTTTTTEKVPMTTLKSPTSIATPIEPTTAQTTEKPASTTTKKLTTTTKKPTTTTKKPTTTTKKPTTTTKKPTITKITTENPTTTSASFMSTVPTTTEIITTTKKAQAQKPQSLSDLVKSKSKTKPAIKTTTANPSKLKTTTPIDEENGEFPSVAGEEIDDDLNSIITNSTVNKPQCKNVQCFPAPSKDTCTVIPLTDCYLIKLLGSAADCCATYKCKSDKGNAIQFGMMDGISETVVSSPISKEDESSPKCSLDMHEVTTKKPKKEKYFEIDVVNSEPKPEKLRPVMIFDFVNNEVSFISYEVRYVKSCTGVSCSPPSGLDIKYCQKLPKGTVPKQMKPLGITSACCFVWKCTMSDGGVSTHYGISQKPSLHIPFEYNGENTDKLPKSLTVKEPESALAVSKCETVLCAPPLRFAVCKIANPSAIKLVKGSLRQKKKCCPVWICRRQEGSTITLYGRTSPKAYNMSNIQSILRGKFFTPEPKDNEIKTPKKAISKPVLKSSMKFGPHSWPHITSTTAEPEEFQTEKPPTKKPTPKNKVKPSNKKPSKPSKIPKPKKAEIKKQLTQQEQLAAMQRDNMDNLKLMQANDQLEDQTSADPDEESSTAEADLDIIDDGASNAGVDVGVNPGSNNRMVQRMQMNGMVMETNMQQSGGPPMPMQNMQLPGMTMTQYG